MQTNKHSIQTSLCAEIWIVNKTHPLYWHCYSSKSVFLMSGHSSQFSSSCKNFFSLKYCVNVCCELRSIFIIKTFNQFLTLNFESAAAIKKTFQWPHRGWLYFNGFFYSHSSEYKCFDLLTFNRGKQINTNKRTPKSAIFTGC